MNGSGNLFRALDRCSTPIPMRWALSPTRYLARIIRAVNHNSGNRLSADDIGVGFNVLGVERHLAFRYRGKPLLDRQVRLVRNMRARLRRR